MTKDEILIDLEHKGIILVIENNYMMTEKYKELLEVSIAKEPPKSIEVDLDYDALLNTKTAGKNWPVEVIEGDGRTRYRAIMNVCEIPITAPKGYRLRGSTKEAINIISNIVADPLVCPMTFMEAIKLYYAYTEMPKGFKSLVETGEVLDLYEEHIKGTLKPSLIAESSDKNNQTWQ